MTAWIKKNPFATDPTMEMIRLVSKQATLSGTPLTDFECNVLASENPDVDESTERRLRALVATVIANEKASGQDADPRSFVNAVEWAGDGEWPYVVAVAAAEISGTQSVEKVDRHSYSGAWIIGGCFVVVLVVIVLVLLAHKL